MKPVERVELTSLCLTATGERRKLLGSSSKIIKGEKKGVLTRILYMTPHQESGGSFCPWATQGCSDGCLGHSTGRMRMPTSVEARYAKAVWFNEYREHFLAQLNWEIEGHRMLAETRDMIAAVRPNGSTDILWERHGVPQEHPTVQLYDYTKAPLRVRRDIPNNYHLTYSFSEDPHAWKRSLEWLEAGRNVAVVLRTPEEVEAAVNYGLWGFPVVNGDESDVRFFDPPGSVVALHAKGAAMQDKSGFVIDYVLKMAQRA